MNHAIICLMEELRALQDGRRQMLAEAYPKDHMLGQTQKEIDQVKRAITLLRQADAAARQAA